jgi:hypothetical protein
MARAKISVGTGRCPELPARATGLAEPAELDRRPAPPLGRPLEEQGDFMKLHAAYVSVAEFDDQYFQVSFDTQDPGDEFDLSAPLQPYLLIQRQFEDDDGGVCYIETHDPNTYVGHFNLSLIELTPKRLAFEIDRPNDRMVEVTYTLDATRFREVKRIVHILFGVAG